MNVRVKTPVFKEAQPGGFFGYWVLLVFCGVLNYEWQVLNVIHIK